MGRQSVFVSGRFGRSFWGKIRVRLDYCYPCQTIFESIHQLDTDLLKTSSCLLVQVNYRKQISFELISFFFWTTELHKGAFFLFLKGISGWKSNRSAREEPIFVWGHYKPPISRMEICRYSFFRNRWLFMPMSSPLTSKFSRFITLTSSLYDLKVLIIE